MATNLEQEPAKSAAASEPDRAKRFRARSAAFDDQRRRQIELSGGRSIPVLEHQMVLEDYLSISVRRASFRYPMFKLQLELLMDLIQAEKSVASYKAKREELEGVETDPEIGHKKEAIDAEREMYVRMRQALRDIGDGIAWRLFDHDRAVLAILASRARKPHINIEGLGAELDEFSEVFNEFDAIAVLNDLTHFLKRADITVRLDDETFEFIEVKASRTKSGALKRQRSDLRETVEFLNTGVREEDGIRSVIQLLQVTPKSQLKSIAPIISAAERNGTSYGRVGDYLIVDFLDWPAIISSKIQEMPESLKRVQDLVEEWRSRGDLVIDQWGGDRYFEVGGLAPFSIYPLPLAQRVKLMTNSLVARSHVNISAVLRYVESRGWDVMQGPDFHAKALAESTVSEAPVATLRKDSLTVDLPGAWIGRIAAEYLSPKTVVEMLEALLRTGPGEASGEDSRLLTNLAGEAALWD